MTRDMLKTQMQELLSGEQDINTGNPIITTKGIHQTEAVFYLLDKAGWGDLADAPCDLCDARREFEADAYEGYLTAMEIATEGR